MQGQTFRRVFAVALIGAITFGAAPLARGDDKRPVPDYDGRGNPDADAGSWALWIPRAVLAPAYLVHEYGVRRPLGALITRAERSRWLSALHDLITFGSREQFMVIPTAFYDFGLSPSIGARFTAIGVGAPGNDISAHAATWGRAWLVASLRDQYRWSGNTALTTRVDFSRRPDHLYMGIGPDVRKSDRSRYGLQKLEAGATLSHTAGDAQLVVQAGVRRVAVRPGSGVGDPALADLIRDEEMAAPTGYDAPYTALYQRVALTLDTRSREPRPGTGARLAVYGESDFDVAADRRWTKLGASLGGALDLNGRGRTLKLQLAADIVDPFDGAMTDTVPFTELASLGGDTMQGFVTGWMRGRSTVMAELAYTWPVWAYVDGAVHLAAGNAFGEHLAGFAPDKLRVSADIGVAMVGSPSGGLEILVGLGTETLEQGGHINSFRFAFGTRRGF
jgi:hypothetical protein